MRVKATKRLTARKNALRITVHNAANTTVATAKTTKKRGKLSLRLSGTAEVGGYKYFVRRGKTVLAKGGFKVKPTKGATLAANKQMVLRAR